MYVRNQRRVSKRAGIEFDHFQLSADITQAEVMAQIYRLNDDWTVSGIILQRPIPDHLDLKEIQGSIAPNKDVEGMHPANIGKVVYNDYVMGPCTSLASMECLRATKADMRGMDAVVVGHSEIVGKPLALHLLGELATVTVCHHETRQLAMHTRRADVLFVAVGKPNLITADMVKPGAVIIDIGINQITVPDGEGGKKRKTVGDVAFDEVSDVAGWITPVPGGVGPVTLAILMRNVVATLETS